jgi:hypothetical protein
MKDILMFLIPWPFALHITGMIFGLRKNPLEYWLKTAGTLMLLIVVPLSGALTGTPQIVYIASILFMAGGDFVLARAKYLSKAESERDFMIGTGLFMVAYILFSLTMVLTFGITPWWWIAVVVLLPISIYLYTTFKIDGIMKIIVVFYFLQAIFLVIGGLSFSANLTTLILATAGTSLFFTSDVFIGMNTFGKSPFKEPELPIMLTYAFGHALVLGAWLLA